jgi:glycosyltransferase involved in cell wall biosynthesis
VQIDNQGERARGEGNTTPLVSVILPSFNHVRYLSNRINSIINQTYRNIELIILDDGSTDGSQSLILSYDFQIPVRMLLSRDNSGSTYHQWEKGLRFANGEYVWFAESDDECSEDFLSTIVQVIENERRAALAFTLSYEIDDSSKIIAGSSINQFFSRGPDTSLNDILCYDGQKFARQYLSNENGIPNASSVLFNKKLLTAHIRAVSEFKYLGDWYLYLALCREGRVVNCNRPLNYFRRHSNTTRAKGRHFNSSGQLVLEYALVQRFMVRCQLKSMSDADIAVNEYIARIARVEELKILLNYQKLYDHLTRFNFSRLVIYGYGHVGASVVSGLEESGRLNRNLIVIDRSTFPGSVATNAQFITPKDYESLFELNDLLLICTFAYADEIRIGIEQLNPHLRTITLEEAMHYCI